MDEQEAMKDEKTLVCSVCTREVDELVKIETEVNHRWTEVFICDSCADGYYQALEACDFLDC